MASRNVELTLLGHDRTGNAMRSAGNNLDQLERKLNRFDGIGKRFGKSGGHAGAAFVAGFLKTLTFGQLGSGFAMAATKLAPKAAHIGGGIGIALAAGLAAKLVGALHAVAPLAVGALGVIPALVLAKTDKDVKKSIKNLKSHVLSFLKDVSKPFKPGFLRAIEVVEHKLGTLSGPLSRLFKGIGDALPQFASGAMDGLTNFLDAISSDSVKAGLKEWGRQLPGIGKALGDLIAKILQDPETTVQSVKDLAKAIGNLAKACGDFIAVADDATAKYGKLAGTVDRFEKKTFQKGGEENLFGLKASTVQKFAQKILPALSQAFTWLQTKFSEAWASLKQRLSEALGGIKGFIDKVVSFFRGLPGKVTGSIRGLGNSIQSVWNGVYNKVTSKVKSIVNSVVSFFRGLPGKAGSAISGLWGRLSGAFSKAKSAAGSAIRSLISSVVAFLRGLPGKAGGAISGLWGRMVGAFNRAKSSAGASARALVNSVASFLRALPGRAAAAISALGGRIAAKIRGAIGAATSAARGVVNAIVSVFRSLPGAVMGVISGLGGRISGAVSGFISSAKSRITSGLGSIKLAKGGWITEPVIGVGQRSGRRYEIAENGPELVTPKNKVGAAGGGGGGSTINVYAQTNANPYAIARELAWTLKTGGF